MMTNENLFWKFMDIAKKNGGDIEEYGAEDVLATTYANAYKKAGKNEKTVMEIFADKFFPLLNNEAQHKAVLGFNRYIDKINRMPGKPLISDFAMLMVMQHEMITTHRYLRRPNPAMKLRDFKTVESGNGFPCHGDLIETSIGNDTYRAEYYLEGNFGHPGVSMAADSIIEKYINGKWEPLVIPEEIEDNKMFMDETSGDIDTYENWEKAGSVDLKKLVEVREIASYSSYGRKEWHKVNISEEEYYKLEEKITPVLIDLEHGVVEDPNRNIDFSELQESIMKELARKNVSLEIIKNVIEDCDFTGELSREDGIARRELDYVMDSVKDMHKSALQEIHCEDDSWER